MAEGSFKGLIIGFVLIGIFMFTILTFAINIANDYGIDDDEITGGAVDFEDLEDYLEGIDTNAEAREQAFKETGLFNIGASDVMTSIWDVAKGVGIMVVTPFSYIAQILLTVFHVPYVIVSATLGILIILLIFATWKVIRTGEG